MGGEFCKGVIEVPRKPLNVGRRIVHRKNGHVRHIAGVKEMKMRSGIHYEYVIKEYNGKMQKQPIIDDILHMQYKLG